MTPHIKPLREELQKIACDELGEVPSRLHKDVQVLREWIQQQPHLKARLDDNFLVQFLRGCKHSLAKAKKKIDYFHTVKTRYPELCHVLDVESAEFRRFHNIGQIAALPTPLNDCGPRIVVFRFKIAGHVYSVEDVISYYSALTEVMMVSDPYAGICGVSYILDMAQVSKHHLVELMPLVTILFAIKEKALPLRIKAFYVINLGNYLEQIAKTLLAFVPEKIQKRIFICGKDFDTLTEHLPRKYLPQEYGGENGSMDQLCADYNKVWDEFREYFKQNAEYGIDERLRLDACSDWINGELYCGGSFRKLEVD